MGSPSTLTLQAGFTADPDAGVLTCEHTERGVALRGAVVGTFDGTGQTVATLSAGSGILPTFRPRKTRRFSVAVDDGGAAAAGFVEVGPTGAVTVYATGDQVSLDGVLIPMGA